MPACRIQIWGVIFCDEYSVTTGLDYRWGSGCTRKSPFRATVIETARSFKVNRCMLQMEKDLHHA